MINKQFQYSDMPEEMRSECVELSMTACEKFANNYEVNELHGALSFASINWFMINSMFDLCKCSID